jgi:Uma2 family endonuclease
MNIVSVGDFFMSIAPKRIWTEAEYLAFERSSEQKHEFLNGEIFAMAGAKENHNLIVTNVIATLHSQVRKRPCRVYPTDMRIKSTATGLHTYPDVVVVFDTPQFEYVERDTLLNPTVIIEVLSPSKEAYERGEKFQNHRTIKSVQECVLISQDNLLLEHYIRQQNHWLVNFPDTLGAVITLPSIDCTLVLSDVYEKVTFENDDEES